MTINISDKILYLGAGCGIGMIIGALFAPRAGHETRETLSRKVDDLGHKMQERVQSAHLAETASETWQNVLQKGKKSPVSGAGGGKWRSLWAADSTNQLKRTFSSSR